MAKKLLVACGSGIATSTVAATKIKEALQALGKGDKVNIQQGRVSELVAKADQYDLIVTTARVSLQLKTPIVSGLPFITGVGVDKTIKEIVEKLGI